MANNLTFAQDVQPTSKQPPDANDIVTVAFGGWTSKIFWVQGTEHGSEEVNFKLNFDFDGATSIELLPELFKPGNDSDSYPAGKLNLNSEAVLDTILLLPANMLTSPVGTIDLPFKVRAGSGIRLNARRVGGAAPTLTPVTVESGGGWRGA